MVDPFDVGPDDALSGVAMMFDELAGQLRPVSPQTLANAFSAIVRVAVQRIDGANAASITTARRGGFSTEASTHERARQGDAIQYELGSGPCVDAIVKKPMLQPVDLPHDDRWPEFGRRAHRDLGWSSMLSYRLFWEMDEDDPVASLNVYAEQPHAFDVPATTTGLLLATHAAVALAAESHRERAARLGQALLNSRTIGVAMGILMNRHRITRDQAFNLLRIASQNTNRKLTSIAEEVGDTGALPILGG